MQHMPFIPLHFDQFSLTMASNEEFMLLVEVTELCIYDSQNLSLHLESKDTDVVHAIVGSLKQIMFVYS